MTTITPLILGSGRAGQAIAKSFACVGLLSDELKVAPPVQIPRGTPLREVRQSYANPVLCVSNPHGLHAEAILEADEAKFDGILCEKPACVSLAELKRLREIKTPTAVLHVYRQTWGLQTLKGFIEEGRFGEIITIEGRYWQASTAERALHPNADAAKTWKDDPRLSGEFDTFLDVGTHWVDAVSYLFGAAPTQIHGWRSYVNAASPHRDSHVQVRMSYPKGIRALGSISKTVHGATNHFEINVIGSKLSATWQFLSPDELLIGEGRDRKILSRRSCELGSGQPPHHGMGWLEGYVEIVHRLLQRIYLNRNFEYPELKGNLEILEAMLLTNWEA